MSAHPDGSPMGKAAPKHIRVARNHCHNVFDRVWKDAHKLPEYQSVFYPEKIFSKHEKKENRRARKAIRRACRTRAYFYMAHRLGVPEKHVHLGMITDIDLLRRFYKIARKATPKSVRKWWKQEGYELYGKNKGCG